MSSSLKRGLIAAGAAMTLLTACGSATSGGSSPSLAVSVAPAPAPGTILNATKATALLDAVTANLTTVHETLSINTSLAPVTGEGDLAQDGTGLRVHMTLAVPGVGQLELTAVGSGFYLKNLPRTGGKWIKLDLTDKRNTTAQTFGALTTISPSRMFGQYAGGVTEATFIGTDATGDHYQLLVNSAQALAHLPQSLAGNPAIIQGMKRLPRTVKLDLWVKGGLLQQTLLDQGTAGTVTAKFTKFGEAVDIQVPPTSEMTTLPELG